MLEFIKNKWLRFIVIVFIGVVFKFLHDVTFGLIYKRYDITRNFHEYTYSVILAFIAINGIRLIYKLLKRYFDSERYFKRQIITRIALNMTIAITVVVFLRLAINIYFSDAGFIRLMDESIVAMLTVFAVGLITLVDFSVEFMHKWRTSLAETERFKKESVEFHFEMLRTQINPHFLFNSLNTLSGLIYKDVDIAANFTRELADVYRYVLANRKNDTVCLKEEYDFLIAYKYLLELRFENNLSFEIDIDEKYFEYLIAPMTLQMLIENAVKHNIISRKKSLTIKIFTKESSIVVSNNYQPKRNQDFSSGIGLNNIRSRYAVLTKNNIKVVRSEEEFTVTIPLIRKRELLQ